MRDSSLVMKSPIVPHSLSIAVIVGEVGGVVSAASMIVSVLELALYSPLVSTVSALTMY